MKVGKQPILHLPGTFTTRFMHANSLYVHMKRSSERRIVGRCSVVVGMALGPLMGPAKLTAVTLYIRLAPALAMDIPLVNMNI